MKHAMVLVWCQVFLAAAAMSGCGSDEEKSGSKGSGRGSGGGSGLGPAVKMGSGNTNIDGGSYVGGTKKLNDDELQELRGAACTGWSLEPEPGPAVLQFVIDKSTSMNDTAPSTGNQTKWEATRDALLATYPTLSPSLGIGQFFFPNVQRSFGDRQVGCVDPNGGLAVDLAPLNPDQVAALMAGVNAVPNPTTPAGTPTHDAWREGVRRLDLALNTPGAPLAGAEGYVVLMTDGMPVRALDCAPPEGGGVAVNEVQFDQLIEDVRVTTADTGLRTFVIGVPGSENDNQVPKEPGSDTELDYVPRTKLSELAVAGGTAPPGCSTTGPNYCHIDMTTEVDFGRALQEQLTEIAGLIVRCTYSLPAPPPGETLDPDAVNAVYTTGAGERILIMRSSSESCEEGWYYSGDGSNVHLCAGTCDQVSSDPQAKFELLFGCATITGGQVK